MNARNRGREVAQEQALNSTCGQQTQTRVPRRGCKVKPLTAKPDNLSSGSQAHRKARWQEVSYNTCEETPQEFRRQLAWLCSLLSSSSASNTPRK